MVLASVFGASLGPVGWTVAVLLATLGSMGRALWNQWKHVEASNATEYPNEGLRRMVRDVSKLSDDQLRQLMNNTGGGVSALYALRQAAQVNGTSVPGLYGYLRRLAPEQIKELVRETHHVLDNHLDKASGKVAATGENDDTAGTTVERTKTVDDMGTSVTYTVKEVVRPESLVGLLKFMERRYGALPKVAPVAPPQDPAPVSTAQPVVVPEMYTVKPGDTFGKIAAERHKSLEEILNLPENQKMFDLNLLGRK
jgi:uncharacterized protein YjeT (DUF2065 family)